MNLWNQTPAGENSHVHIERFLKDYPVGHLYVVSGYASVHGLAWLQRHAKRRPVTLVIGDVDRSRFESASDNDRVDAAKFLHRDNVTVLNWSPTGRNTLGEAMMHAKGWVVTRGKTRKPVAGLIGSANLTKTGLNYNWEMMGRVYRKDLPRIASQLEGLLSGANGNKAPWDVKQKLLGFIQIGYKPTPKRQQQQQTKQRGCITSAVAVLAAMIAVAFMVVWLF